MPTTIQIKRGLRKNVPTTDAYPGQMFLATDTMELFATGMDLRVSKLRDIVVSTHEPINKVANQLWFDTVTNQLKVHNGSDWSPAEDGRIGHLHNLLTADKSSIVGAINEVYQMCLGDISFEEFLGKTVNVSFFSGAFCKKAVGAVLSGTAGNSIILTPPTGTSNFKMLTLIPGVAPIPQNNNPLLESYAFKMLIPLRQLTSIELACSAVILSLAAEPSDGPAPLDVTLHCFVNEPQSIKEYRWDFIGDGIVDATTSTGTTTFQYTKPGTYTVTCTVLDKCGCTITSSPVFISVQDKSQRPLLTASPRTGATPLVVSFNCACQNPDQNSAYQWDFGDGYPIIITQSNSCQHTFQKPGTFLTKCRVLDKYGSLTTSHSLSIYVIESCFAHPMHTQVIDPWKACQPNGLYKSQPQSYSRKV